MTTVIVSGALANRPFNGGGAWVRLSWLRGLERLGFDVVFVEQIAPKSCVAADGSRTTFDTSVNRDYFEQVMREFSLAERSALVLANGNQTAGLSFDALLERTADAALLINITGHLTLEPVLRLVKRKVFLDLDPGFTQAWHADGVQRIPEHDLYFTIAENIGRPGCSLPTGGLRWLPTRQPVVLDDWPVAVNGSGSAYTTVASWRGPYGRVELNGRKMGVKAHEFRKLISLPSQTGRTFELALDIHPGDDRDRIALVRNGWRLVDPRLAVGNPERFRRYVSGSAGEFSPAQEIYTATRSGWFSDRTVRYLASGRPAIVQDTGFSRNLPVGEGLLAFLTLEEAIAAVRKLERDRHAHRRAARAVAEELFDSDAVLARFVEMAGVSP